MSHDYSPEIKAAQDAIDEFGASAILSRVSGSYPCKALIAAYSAIERATSLIQYADRKILIAAADLPVTPDVELDKLIIANQTFRLVTVILIAPGNVPILWELQCRL